MISFFTQMLSGPSGKPSWARGGSAVVVLSICFCAVYLTVINKKFPELPKEAWAAVVGALAVKAYQRGKEQDINKQ